MPARGSRPQRQAARVGEATTRNDRGMFIFEGVFCDKSKGILRFSYSGDVFCDKSNEIIRFSCSGGVFCDKSNGIIRFSCSGDVHASDRTCFL